MNSETETLELPFFANIPYNVQIDENLSDGAKIYFGQIIGLAKKFGYMWATDDQLADMKKVSKRTIERWNNELEESGFIRRETSNFPVKGENGAFNWIKKRKIYFNDSLAFGSPRKLEIPSQNEPAKNGGSLDTAKNGGSLDTAKNGGIISAPLDSIPKVQPTPAAIVVSSLEKLEISDSLKKKISQEKSESEINIAVQRCLRWKNRPSDEIGIMTVLSRADSWNDNPTVEEREEDNLTFLKSLKSYDMKILANTQIVVGHNYIEFSAGQKTIVYSIKDQDFKKITIEYLEYLKTIQENRG